MKKFNLLIYLTEKLNLLGAKKGQLRDFVIETKAGRLEISVYGDGDYPWVACIFGDPQKAKEVVRTGCLNKSSGKWNWHSFPGEDRKVFADQVMRHIMAIV